jgi:hypothetical protein
LYLLNQFLLITFLTPYTNPLNNRKMTPPSIGNPGGGGGGIGGGTACP